MSAGPLQQPKTCEFCGRDVDGSCDGVKLTVCSRGCCIETEPDVTLRLVTRERALTEHGCTENDLMLLDSYTKPSLSRLFQPTEVKHLSRMRQDREQNGESETPGQSGERPVAQSSRAWCSVNISGPCLSELCDLLDDFGIDKEMWDKRNRIVWYFMLRDYLTTIGSTRVQKQDVKRRFDVLKRVEDIVEVCPDAHPDAVFDVCLAHADVGPIEFQSLKDKILQVFRAESGRILRHLTQAELRMLERTPLAEEAWPLLKRGRTAAYLGFLLGP